jgi:hypothetical protein
MRAEILSKLYDDFVTLTHKYDLQSEQVVEFILTFLIFNMRADFDEEDARVFAHHFYKAMVRELNMRKRHP